MDKTVKLKKTLKYDFSYTNWGETTGRWLKGIKKRYADLFPEVSKQARILAGIKFKPTNADAELSSESYSGSDSGRDLDSDHEGFQVQVGNASDNDNEGDDGHGSDGGPAGKEGSDDEGLRVEGEGDEFAASGDDIYGAGGVEGTAGDEDYEMLEPEIHDEEPAEPASVSDLSDITASDYY
jgi:hypothetical protein